MKRKAGGRSDSERPIQAKALPGNIYPRDGRVTYLEIVEVDTAHRVLQTIRFHIEPVLPLVLPSNLDSNNGSFTRHRYNDRGTERNWLINKKERLPFQITFLFERKTRLELATPTLARSCSTN